MFYVHQIKALPAGYVKDTIFNVIMCYVCVTLVCAIVWAAHRHTKSDDDCTAYTVDRAVQWTTREYINIIYVCMYMLSLLRANEILLHNVYRQQACSYNRKPSSDRSPNVIHERPVKTRCHTTSDCPLQRRIVLYSSTQTKYI